MYKQPSIYVCGYLRLSQEMYFHKKRYFGQRSASLFRPPLSFEERAG